MKKQIIKSAFILSLFIAALLSSCAKDDGYSLDKFWVDIATINTVGNDVVYFRLDDGTTLFPATSIGEIPKSHHNQRAWVNYTILSDRINGYDHLVAINSMSYVLTKKIVDLTPANKESIGNDPIQLKSMWIGDGFLNIHYKYKLSGAKTHVLNLVNNTLTNTSKGDSIVLELRHNANQDQPKYSTTGYVAFDLKQYTPKENEPILFTIKVLDLDNTMKTYTIMYKSKNNPR